MISEPIKVLVVDDTAIYRKIVSDVLSDMPNVEVVGVAANGQIAMEKIEQVKPDIITLDVEMPVMNGLDVLEALKEKNSPVMAIMLSAFTTEGANSTMAALELGAVDFIVKPAGHSVEENIEKLYKDLVPKIEALANRVKDKQSSDSSLTNVAAQHKYETTGIPEVVAIGISTGGPQALTKMLPNLTCDLNVPVLIVQHMPPVFTKSLADDLNKKCELTVHEAEDGQVLEPNHVYIAPGGKQMKIKDELHQVKIVITDDPPENSCSPSVDYLFRSISQVYKANALGVIMTGMGNDGSLGCRLLKRQGCPIIAQDKETCVVFGMPREPIENGLVDIVTSLDNIALEIKKQICRGAVV